MVGSRRWNVPRQAALFVIAFLFAFPVLWMILTSFRPPAQVFYAWRGTQFTLANFVRALEWPGIREAYRNSAIIATVSTVLSLVVTTLSGYFLGRYRNRLSRMWFGVIYLLRTIPYISWALPLYLLETRMGLFDTFTGLIAPHVAIHVAFFSWLMKGFFETVPRELEEAAGLDGCSRWRALIQVVLPCVLPGVVALGVLGWLWTWSEFLLALVLTGQNVPMYSMAVIQFSHEMGIQWDLMSAASVLGLVPALIVAVVGQRFIVEALALDLH